MTKEEMENKRSDALRDFGYGPLEDGSCFEKDAFLDGWDACATEYEKEIGKFMASNGVGSAHIKNITKLTNQLAIAMDALIEIHQGNSRTDSKMIYGGYQMMQVAGKALIEITK